MVVFTRSLLALGFSTLVAAQYGYGSPGGSSTAAAPASSATATATNGVIDVQAGNVAFTYNPSTIQAKVGDTINFHFYGPDTHSVSESSFASPCSYKPGGIWSGFFNTTSSGVVVRWRSGVWVEGHALTSKIQSNMFSVTLNDTEPHWLYCAQTEFSHCQSGMVMVINPP